MEPAKREPGQEQAEEQSRFGRTRVWAAARRADAERLAERAQEERGRHRSLDAVYEMVDRDGEVAGGIIAGALAYRLFIWLLPLALVVVAGLGIAADSRSETPSQAAGEVGMEGLVSSSISGAAESPKRWYALVVGIPILIWATRSLLRVLIGAHRLVWTEDRRGAPKPKVGAAIRLLALLLCFGVVSTVASAVRAWSPWPGLVVTLCAVVFYAAIWLLVIVRLPHHDTDWTALLPGAILFGVGIELLHVVLAYVIAPYAAAKQGTYGALGVAAGLLVGLFLISRLIVASAVVNATLWARRDAEARQG